MSNRERWIIYPLLFLSLGIAMRDKFAPTVKFNGTVECVELIVSRIRPKAATLGGPKVLGIDGNVECRQFICEDLDVRGKATANLMQANRADVLRLRVVEKGSENSRPTVELVTTHVRVPSEPGEEASESTKIVPIGLVMVYGAGKTPIVSLGSLNSGSAGLVQTMTSDGRELVTLGQTTRGGLVSTYDLEKDLQLTMLHDEVFAGIYAISGGKFIRPLSLAERGLLPDRPQPDAAEEEADDSEASDGEAGSGDVPAEAEAEEATTPAASDETDAETDSEPEGEEAN